MRTTLLSASLAGACLLLAGCGKDPDTNAALRESQQHHELKHAIDAVDEREKAARANDAVIEADKKREQDLKDAGG
jgi:hypothetical protein